MIDYAAITANISPAQLAAAIGAEKSGSGWRCPNAAAHTNGDSNPSFSIFRHEGRTCAKCHSCALSGDAVKVAAEVWGIPNSEAARRLSGNLGIHTASEIVAEYVYQTAEGIPSLKVVRKSDKSFLQAAWTRQTWDFKAAKPKLLYRLPELLAEPERLLIIVEGEKDADRLAQEGFLPTTNPGGAGKWRDEYSQCLAGRHICIIPDNDKAGHQHAVDVARSLMSTRCKVRVAELPGVKPKGDVSDWLDAGGTASHLRELIRQAPVLDAAGLHKLASAWELEIASNGAANEDALEFTSWKDFLAEADERTEWLVDGLLPAGGLSLLVSKPKTGKSTLVRCLVVAVAEGKPWLGRATRQERCCTSLPRKNVRNVRSTSGVWGPPRNRLSMCSSPAFPWPLWKSYSKKPNENGQS